MILRVSITDCNAFILIYAYILYVVSLITKSKLLNYPYNSDVHRFPLGTQILDTFSLTLGFGDSPSANLHDDPKYNVPKGEWVIFVFAMFTMTILILNTLIAILGDR